MSGFRHFRKRRDDYGFKRRHASVPIAAVSLSFFSPRPLASLFFLKAQKYGHVTGLFTLADFSSASRHVPRARRYSRQRYIYAFKDASTRLNFVLLHFDYYYYHLGVYRLHEILISFRQGFRLHEANYFNLVFCTNRIFKSFNMRRHCVTSARDY